MEAKRAFPYLCVLRQVEIAFQQFPMRFLRLVVYGELLGLGGGRHGDFLTLHSLEALLSKPIAEFLSNSAMMETCPMN